MADPTLVTSRIGFDQETQTAWVLIPPNMVAIGSGASGAAMINMGTAEAVASGATIPAGTWVFTSGTASLIKSDGTATAPSAGNIYELT
jgi:hypothetical protein